jgi:acyl-coenzyme A thioesterase PaaI-like protein
MSSPSASETHEPPPGGAEELEQPAPIGLRALGRESMRSRAIRWLLNRLPSYRRAGGKLVYVCADLTHARVRIKYGWRTYGQKGSILGGALYAAIDPCHVAMLQWRLGKDYVVWDKRAVIDFKKPGRSTLYADIVCSEETLAAIRQRADREGRTEQVFTVILFDQNNTVHLVCQKTLAIKRRVAT